MIITLLILVTGYKFKITIMNDKKSPKIKKKFWLKICNKNLKLFCSWWVQSAPSSFCGRCPSPEGPPAACCSGPVNDFLCLSRLQFPTDRKNERRQCIPFFTLTFSFYHWLFVWFSLSSSFSLSLSFFLSPPLSHLTLNTNTVYYIRQ